MPTGLPPRRAAGPPEEERDDREEVVLPVLIIVMLVIANIALYCDRYGPPTAYTIAASPSELQLSP